MCVCVCYSVCSVFPTSRGSCLVLFASFRFSTSFSNSLPSSRPSPSTSVIYSLWIRWFYKNVLAFFVLSSFFRSHCCVLLPLLLFYILSFTSLHVYVALYERLSFFFCSCLFLLLILLLLLFSSLLLLLLLANTQVSFVFYVLSLSLHYFNSLALLFRTGRCLCSFFCGLSSVFFIACTTSFFFFAHYCASCMLDCCCCFCRAVSLRWDFSITPVPAYWHWLAWGVWYGANAHSNHVFGRCRKLSSPSPPIRAHRNADGRGEAGGRIESATKANAWHACSFDCIHCMSGAV